MSPAAVESVPYSPCRWRVRSSVCHQWRVR